MKKTMIYIGPIFLLLVLAGGSFFMYLNRGLSHEIVPATFTCLNLEEGKFVPFDTVPKQIYGVGLSYAGHINETASEFDPGADPPIFKKAIASIAGDGAKVGIPSHEDLVQAAVQIEPGLGEKLHSTHNPLPALLDYEVELGFVLLEDIDEKQLNQEDYIPKIGFFIANDLSARSIAILGEGQDKRYDYWGISKSFQGFSPVSQQVWIPNEFQANAIPCVNLQTEVNGKIRQNQQTSDMIYTPLEMLQAIHRRYPNTPLKKGDWVLSGTPGGVILTTPRWLVRMANMIKMDRFGKLSSKTKEAEVANFLKPGDTVIAKGEGLGSVTIEIAAQ